MPSKVGSVDEGRDFSTSSLLGSPQFSTSTLSSPTSTVGHASSIAGIPGRTHLPSQRKPSNRSLRNAFSSTQASAAPLASRKISNAATYPPPLSIKDGGDVDDNVSIIGDKEKDEKGKDSKPDNAKAVVTTVKEIIPLRVRQYPHMHHHKANVESPTLMYWSRAPVWGTLPGHALRAHSVTMIDHVAWVFGGCDESTCFNDLWCLDTETLEWSKPDVLGEPPSACRAHTATQYEKKIFVFGGGAGNTYYNDLHIFDTMTRHWTHPKFVDSPKPAQRRAHTAILHKHNLIIFGGGNGTTALNDIWTLDARLDIEKMRWRQLETKRKGPNARGYHTANLVGDVMMIYGGSDGRTSYSDIWALHLESLRWSQITPSETHIRLAHSSTQIGSFLFIVGGHDGKKYLSDLLYFNLVNLQYEERKAIGRVPPVRGYHAAALSDGRLFLFSGFNGHSYFDDVYVLDLAASAYLPQDTQHATGFAIDDRHLT